MRLPRVRQFCCGCTLYTGALVVSILATLGALSTFINSICGSGSEATATTLVALFYNNGSIGNETLPVSFNDVIHVLHPLFHTVDAIASVQYAIHLTICLCFVYGVVKSKPSFILPWLVVAFIFFVINTINMIAASILLTSIISVGVGVVVLLLVFVCMVPPLYLMTVVYSFYRELKAPRPYNKDFSEPPNLSV